MLIKKHVMVRDFKEAPCLCQHLDRHGTGQQQGEEYLFSRIPRRHTLNSFMSHLWSDIQLHG